MEKPLSSNRLPRQGEAVFTVLVHSATLFSAILLVAIFITLLNDALPAIKTFGLEFIWQQQWDPVAQHFAAGSMIIGTVVTAFIALLIAVPLSFAIAIFLTELAPKRLKKPLSVLIELLAAIPSIVYGMWGLLIFAPWLSRYIQQPLQQLFASVPYLNTLFSGPLLGLGMLSAGILLAIMVTPFISAVMRDLFSLTPVLLKESAYGLGATKWEVIRHIVLPYTRTGIMGGIILGLGRALGETMAVTFIIGNIGQIQGFSLFQPASSITSVLANEFAEATPGLYQSSLFYLGLILFVITLLVLIVAKLLLLRVERQMGQR